VTDEILKIVMGVGIGWAATMFLLCAVIAVIHIAQKIERAVKEWQND
jgi:hypothetical protein